MFFMLSKILWALVVPLNLALILLALGAGLYALKIRRAGAGLAGLALAILLVCGVWPGGYNIMAKLESEWSQPELRTLPRIDGIIVLGGMFNTDISKALGVVSVNGGVERVLDGLMLSGAYPGAKLLFSGGEGKIIRSDHTESDDMISFINQINGDSKKSLYESRSRNTYENALFSHDLVKPQPGETWILVTSAYHMPRSLAVFRSQGWGDITLIPWPTDYQTTAKPGWGVRKFDVLDNMYLTHLLTKELLGYAVYSLTGKIALPR